MQQRESHMTAQSSPSQAGLNLLVYPSSLLNASRVSKLARGLQAACDFEETHAVGIQPGDLEAREELAPGVTIIRILGSGRKGNIGRVLKVLSWQPRVYRSYRHRNVAVVAAQNVWVLPMCARLAKATGAALVYNAHELETEAVAMRGIKRQVARWIERRYIRAAKVISVVNESIAQWYATTYAIVPPIAVTNIAVDDGSEAHLRGQLGLTDDDMLYVHTGHLVALRSIPLIVETFARVPDRHVVFLGDGPLRGLISAAAVEHPNIHWLPPVPADSVVAHVRQADVGLCLIQPLSLSDEFATPNKLFEALCADTPALSTDLVEVRRILGDLGPDWILENPELDLEAAVRRIDKASVADFRKRWPGIGTWEQQLAPLIEAYRGLLGSRSR